MTFDEFLEHFEHVQRLGPQHAKVCYPSHPDKTPSLDVRLEGSKILLYDFGKECHVEDIVAAVNLTMRDLDLAPRPPLPTLTLDAFARAKGLPAAFLAEFIDEMTIGLRINYWTAEGQPAPRQRLRTALVAHDSSKWLGPKGVAPIPYGRWRLQHARQHGEGLLVEGETDSLTAWYHEVPALGLPGSSMGRLLEAEDLVGIRRLSILQEPDDGGVRFRQTCLERLRALGFTGDVWVFDVAPHKDLNALHLAEPQRFMACLTEAMARGEKILGPDRTPHE
jgi:putative DNA primase/helicase